MLIEFRFKNYRSFRDETILSMEATGLGSLKSCLIGFNHHKLLPGVAIYGKNGGGKSNVIRAFWLATQFIKDAQKTQHEKAAIPVIPFALNDYSKDEPSEFSFIYTLDGIKYWYSFPLPGKRFFRKRSIMPQKDRKRWFFPEKVRNSPLRKKKQNAG